MPGHLTIAMFLAAFCRVAQRRSTGLAAAPMLVMGFGVPGGGFGRIPVPQADVTLPSVTLPSVTPPSVAGAALIVLPGVVLVPDAEAHLTWATFLMILAGLCILRPVAIRIGLIAAVARPETRFFLRLVRPDRMPVEPSADAIERRMNQP